MCHFASISFAWLTTSDCSALFVIRHVMKPASAFLRCHGSPTVVCNVDRNNRLSRSACCSPLCSWVSLSDGCCNCCCLSLTATAFLAYIPACTHPTMYVNNTLEVHAFGTAADTGHDTHTVSCRITCERRNKRDHDARERDRHHRGGRVQRRLLAANVQQVVREAAQVDEECHARQHTHARCPGVLPERNLRWQPCLDLQCHY